MSPGGIWMVIGVFAFAVIITDLMRRFALRNNLLDVPNARSSHVFPTPRGGGVAIVGAFFCAVLALAIVGMLDVKVAGALLCGGGAMALIGFLDDRRPLPAGVRFAVHFLAAMLVVIMIGGIPERSLAVWQLHGAWVGGLIAVLAVVWVSNLFNFMDGIDGIAGSEAVFVTGAGAWLNALHGGDAGLTSAMLCLTAASLGFLMWNWPPARIFMGDVGSGFLGFTVATLGLAMSQKSSLPVEVWPILGGVFLVDATITLIARIARGERWFEAHRTHAYQHLARLWKGHLPVTAVMIVVNLVWLLPWAWFAAARPELAARCAAAALVPLVVAIIASGAGRREK
jgi:Fuc2NAc and GlcNAc transferase